MPHHVRVINKVYYVKSHRVLTPCSRAQLMSKLCCAGRLAPAQLWCSGKQSASCLHYEHVFHEIKTFEWRRRGKKCLTALLLRDLPCRDSDVKPYGGVGGGADAACWGKGNVKCGTTCMHVPVWMKAMRMEGIHVFCEVTFKISFGVSH